MKVLLVVKRTDIEPLGVMYLSRVVGVGGGECRIVGHGDCLRVVGEWCPDVVGFSVMTGDQGLMRGYGGVVGGMGARVVYGGPHASFFPADFGGCDVILGDGEAGFAEYLGIRLNGGVVWPDRGDFPKRRMRDFIASRGCPYDCSFCYNRRWAEVSGYEKRVVQRDVTDVCAEVREVAPEFAYFQDSCFGLSLRWLGEFAREYPRIPFHCHLRPEQCVDDRMFLLKSAGCYSVRIALESAVPRLRGLLNRETATGDKVSEGVRLCRKYGIRVMIQNMVGLPGGTIEDDLTTLEANVRCGPDYSWVSIYTPYPGTALGDYCVREGLYSGDYSDLGDNFFDTSYLNIPQGYREQLECLQRIWALSVETQTIPNISELTHKNIMKYVHRAMRKLGDGRLYGGIV